MTAVEAGGPATLDGGLRMAECVDCGRTLSEVARFCPGCGSPVQETMVTQAVEIATLAQPAPVAEAPTAPATPAPVEPFEPVVAAPAGPAAVAPVETVLPTAAEADQPREPAVATMVEAPPAQVTSGPPMTAIAAMPAGTTPTCVACGAFVPDGDLFCGECGAPVGGPASGNAPVDPTALPQRPAAPGASPPAAPPAYPAPAAQPAASGAVAYGPQTGYQTSGAGGYFSFGTLLVKTHAVPLFWIAEGVNLFYWIMGWVTSYRWNGAQGFFWAAGGFVLVAVIIRIVMEAAVAASRAGDNDS
jgi:hypothetical protein